MRDYSPATADYFAARGPMLAHVLVWVSARNRATGGTESIGFWTGADHAEFVIGGETRVYYGAGTALSVDPLRLQTGLQVRSQRVQLSQIAAETQLAIRGYDPRHAPVEIHRALFDPLTHALIGEPHLVLRGNIDKAPVRTPSKGETGSIEVEIATAARRLTKPLTRKRSDASLRARAGTDAFRQYASLADKVETPWGRNVRSGSTSAPADVPAGAPKGADR
jgi:hypothetical protein